MNESIENTVPVIVELQHSCDTESLWAAITQHQQMVQWFFAEIPTFRPEIGFETEFVVDTGERKFTHQWKIIDVTIGKNIVYDWSYSGYEGRGLVKFEVLPATPNPDGNPNSQQSTLRITNFGVDTFIADIPEFSRESCKSGWRWFQDELATYLAAKA